MHFDGITEEADFCEHLGPSWWVSQDCWGLPAEDGGLSGSYSSDPLSCLELLLSPRALSTIAGQGKAGMESDDLQGRPFGGSLLRCSFPDSVATNTAESRGLQSSSLG